MESSLGHSTWGEGVNYPFFPEFLLERITIDLIKVFLAILSVRQTRHKLDKVTVFCMPTQSQINNFCNLNSETIMMWKLKVLGEITVARCTAEEDEK